MTATGREIGTLIVVVLKAKNLPNKRHIGKQDPYCSVSFNNEKRRTKAIKRGGQHPEWDEEIRFTLFEDADDASTRPDSAGTPPPLPPKQSIGPSSVQGGKFMKITCWADDTREPDLIGETKVDLTEVLTTGETDEWFALSAKDKYAGEVYLELTFWSNEPAPKKRTKSKPGQYNAQYGGTGEFVPFRDSSSSPRRDYGQLSRQGSETSDFGNDSVPPSLRSTNSSAKIDLYKAPYERNTSMSRIPSTVENVTNDFSELGVGMPDVRQRRETFPPLHGPPLPARPPSAQPPQSNSFSGYRQSSYAEPSSTSSFERPMTSNGFQPRSSFPSAGPVPGYQVPQDTGSSTISYRPPPHRGPRYSLPTSPAGYMPTPPPASSGFVLRQPESSGFTPRPAPTPAPMNYGVPPSISHPSFVSHTPAPSGFMPTSSSMPFQPSYQYPPYQHASATPAPYMPTSSVPPPPSLPPQQYAPPLPPASVPPHSYSAPPQQLGGHYSSTPSPPDDYRSSLPPSQGGTPPSAHSSRPLPQPQSNPGRRHSTLPVPPGGGYSPSHSPSRPESAYHTGPPPSISYNQIPPPPPLPSHNGWNPDNIQQNNFTAIPPPPPITQSHSDSPSRRSNLPQPPAMPSHHQQQYQQYQQIPPPLNHNTTSQSYYPGSMPTHPYQYPPVSQAVDGGYYAAGGGAWN